jgi:hypothetical protein
MLARLWLHHLISWNIAVTCEVNEWHSIQCNSFGKLRHLMMAGWGRNMLRKGKWKNKNSCSVDRTVLLCVEIISKFVSAINEHQGLWGMQTVESTFGQCTCWWHHLMRKENNWDLRDRALSKITYEKFTNCIGISILLSNVITSMGYLRSEFAINMSILCVRNLLRVLYTLGRQHYAKNICMPIMNSSMLKIESCNFLMI